MIKYVIGKNRSIDEISEDFFGIINPADQVTGTYNDKALVHRLTSAVSSGSEAADFFSKLLEDDFKVLKKVISEDPLGLEQMIVQVEKIREDLGLGPFYEIKRGKPVFTDIGKTVYNVFDYDSFRMGKQCDWLLNELSIPVCPYCNRQDTKTIYADGSPKAKHLLDIDHFYCKAMYPYLSISFYNLIPSCLLCNQRFKSTKEFKIASHTHPYLDNFHDYYKFDYNSIKSVLDDLNFDIVLVPRQGVDESNIVRADNLIRDLGIKTVYQDDMYKNEVKRIQNIAYEYSEVYIQQLLDWYISGTPILANCLTDICRTYGLVADAAQIRVTLFGKLKHDIFFPS